MYYVNFRRWVKEQHTNAPATLWTTAAQAYIDYAQDIVEAHRSTITQLSEAAGTHSLSLCSCRLDSLENGALGRAALPSRLHCSAAFGAPTTD